MPGTEDVEKPVYRKEPVYATKYYYEIDKWTVVDTAKSSGNDQNPSWPEPKLKDGQKTGAEEEHYFVTATYEKKKGKTETGRYEMDFSQWKELKKVEKRIEELETRDKEIDDTLVLPDVCTNVGRCAELSREKDKIQAELEELYEKWEELA